MTYYTGQKYNARGMTMKQVTQNFRLLGEQVLDIEKGD